jgi:hypothetical protein
MYLFSKDDTPPPLLRHTYHPNQPPTIDGEFSVLPVANFLPLPYSADVSRKMH